jgi:hypothetical protein
LEETKEGQMVGNGGLSLRTKDVMIKICEENPVTEQIWEDIYFMKHMKGVGVADVKPRRNLAWKMFIHQTH